MPKLLFKGAVLVIALYVSMLVISRYDTNHKVDDENALRLMASEHVKSVDIIFIGSSYIYNGILPEAFDKAHVKTFNLGIATAGAYFSELLVSDYLISNTTKTVCLAMAYTTFSEMASDVWHLYPIHRYLQNPVTNEEILWKYATVAEYIKMLRSSFEKGVNNVSGKCGIDLDAYLKICQTRGYSFSKDTATRLIYRSEAPLFEPYLGSQFSEKKSAKFLETIEKCKGLGLEVVILEPPTNNLSSYFSEEYKVKYSLFKEQLKKHTALIEAEPANFDSTCFRNTDHLNYNGARLYSCYVKDELGL